MEHVNELEILREAMQIESDAVRFYKQAAKCCSANKKTEEVFKQLAEEEMQQLDKLEVLYDNLVENKEWLVMQDLMDSQHRKMEELKVVEEDLDDEEFDEVTAIDTGIKAEEDSIKFYKEAMRECETGDVRGCEVFKWLVDLEKDHLKRLKDREKEIEDSK
jgi:rubrerythrin